MSCHPQVFLSPVLGAVRETSRHPTGLDRQGSPAPGLQGAPSPRDMAGPAGPFLPLWGSFGDHFLSLKGERSPLTSTGLREAWPRLTRWEGTEGQGFSGRAAALLQELRQPKQPTGKAQSQRRTLLWPEADTWLTRITPVTLWKALFSGSIILKLLQKC